MAENEDKKVLDLVRAQDKEVADVLDQLLASGKITYPINDEKAFVEAVGGANAKVTVGGKNVTVGSLMAKAPGYYFPIADEHELVAKLADLALQQRVPAPGSAAAGKLMPATAEKPDHTPPGVSDEDIHKAKNANPGLSISGFKKQQQ